ncbi:MAG: single-stranded DNA-binding protein [Bifidobacteriaceae bacterium]|nr:single-stranded DNA-binding protein [Bifidobacteriaceae bacterium]
MPIKTSTSMSGFVASTPTLSRTETGDARLYMKVGQEHFIRNPDGSFTQDETSFHDLVMFRRAAEKAAAQFAKGDRFVAEGYIHEYTVTDSDGMMEGREEFVARHIGHDTACTRYSVDRTPRVQQGPTNATGAAPFQAPAAEPAAIGA